jgi:hypothetical protein
MHEAEFLKLAQESMPPPVETKGVGVIATWSPKTQTLGAWQHGYSVRMTVDGPYVTHSEATAKALARIVLKKL